MSRIGKKEILVPNNLKINILSDKIEISDTKMSIYTSIPVDINVVFENNKIYVKRLKEDNKTKALHGLIRKLIFNSVIGFSKKFIKVLQIKGVGYRANVDKNKLVLNVGFSHSLELNIPPNIEVKIDAKQNQIIIQGSNKLLIGDFAAKIRSIKPPEPYKGTGIMYLDEKIIRKAGKSASSSKK